MKKKVIKIPNEWFKQAEYDIETAEAMFKAKEVLIWLKKNL